MDGRRWKVDWASYEDFKMCMGGLEWQLLGVCVGGGV